ncbi:MAG: NADH:ubiquinone oxidoreductase, Na translocating, B subunit [Spirochaetaceae bacterium]|nr:MAG: NADH:ubiquinone oxidoreductase, Na translocating, B subunit [Spirochaetaceae bacterium]
MFMKQPIMRKVVYSLVPIYLFALYMYGWRLLALSAVVFPLGILTEYIVERSRGKKVSEAVLVTCMLFVLILPPAVPLWIAAIGIIFGVFFAKELYGGFGRNIFNPAISARIFVWISFPALFANGFMIPGAFGAAGEAGVDALSASSPLAVLDSGATPEFLDVLLGFTGGSMGEASAVLIILAGIYLVATKTAQWRLIVGTLLGAGALMSALYLSGVSPNYPPQYAIFSGSILFVAVFMSTDPVSAPKKPLSQWLYGFLIGSVAIIIRNVGGFPEGTSFGVLLGNVFASLLDEIMPARKKPSKPAAAKKKAEVSA